MTQSDPTPRHGVIEYDDQDQWLTESDGEGANRIVARDVPRWFGRLVVAALNQHQGLATSDPLRFVEFRGGRFLARLFLVVEPVLGLSRSQRLMAWAITHRPFYRWDVDDAPIMTQSDPTREARPPAPPNGCQTYHGVPGCRCQVRASRAEPHRGAHHCDEHDRYWTDREEMYASMYLSVVAKWGALLEHADLAEDVQPDEVIAALAALSSPPPSLDVDRLHRVLAEIGIIHNGTWVSFFREDAEAIARRYAEGAPHDPE